MSGGADRQILRLDHKTDTATPLGPEDINLFLEQKKAASLEPEDTNFIWTRRPKNLLQTRRQKLDLDQKTSFIWVKRQKLHLHLKTSFIWVKRQKLHLDQKL